MGIADLPTVGAELAAVAQTTLADTLEIATPQVPMAVIGMGKLGGTELNYASDVDVLFAHNGDTTEARRLRALLRVMTEPTADGIVFRTDPALRPEGLGGTEPATRRLRSALGPLGTSVGAPGAHQGAARRRRCRARHCVRRARRHVRLVRRDRPFRGARDPHDEARTEQMLAKRGLETRELKRGYGGIHDIEFTVQLLQLVHGRHDASIRARATWTRSHSSPQAATCRAAKRAAR